MEAAKWVKERVAKEGMTIDARAARLVADRIWPDVSRIRSDVERLMPLIRAHQGKVAVAIKHLDSGESFYEAEDEEMPTASLEASTARTAEAV